MMAALRRHWPAYLMEAAGLIVFMVGAGLFTTAFMHPASPLHQAIGSPLLRRVGMGACMAAMTMGIIYGAKRSGAHINPMMTLAFLSRGKMSGPDAAWYVVFQFAGGLIGPSLALALIGDMFRDPAVNMGASLPGALGAAGAFAAEFVITLGLTLVALLLADSRRLRIWSGVVVGVLIGLYVVFESPLSGMSMNPARSLGSALASGLREGLWIYFTAPTLAVMAALAVYGALRRTGRVGPGPRSWLSDYDEGPCYPLEPDYRPLR